MTIYMNPVLYIECIEMQVLPCPKNKNIFLIEDIAAICMFCLFPNSFFTFIKNEKRQQQQQHQLISDSHEI